MSFRERLIVSFEEIVINNLSEWIGIFFNLSVNNFGNFFTLPIASFVLLSNRFVKDNDSYIHVLFNKTLMKSCKTHEKLTRR